MGLPCYHIMWQRRQENGVLLLTDIDRHWYYNRDFSMEGNTLVPRPVLEPVVIRVKGRPKGALGGGRIAPSIRRNPSAFELPSSSTPPAVFLASLPPVDLQERRTIMSRHVPSLASASCPEYHTLLVLSSELLRLLAASRCIPKMPMATMILTS